MTDDLTDTSVLTDLIASHKNRMIEEKAVKDAADDLFNRRQQNANTQINKLAANVAAMNIHELYSVPKTLMRHEHPWGNGSSSPGPWYVVKLSNKLALASNERVTEFLKIEPRNGRIYGLHIEPHFEPITEAGDEVLTYFEGQLFIDYVAECVAAIQLKSENEER